MLPYFALPFDHPESLPEGDYVLATYLAYGLPEEKVLTRVGNFAVGQTVGTWVPVPGITQEMVRNHEARVVGCYPVSPARDTSAAGEGTYLLRVAFPRANFGTSFAMLLTALVGNDASTALRAKLIDLELVGKAIEAFPGPAHGIPGLRRLTGVEGRPLVMNMLKPCTGYPPEVGADLFYAVGSGGVDLIKDDELLGSTDFSSVAGRVKAYLAAARRIQEEMGRAPLYLPNITDRPERMRDNARAALEAGAKGVMVNFVLTGFDALASLTAEFGRDLFFLGHFAGAGIIGNGEDQGISVPTLLGRLPRLAGADAVVTMYPAGGQGPGYFDLLRTVQAHRLPLGRLKPVFSVVGGGVTPLNVTPLYRDLGPDIIIAVGGGVQGHPQGATAGARAMMQAVEATIAGRDLAEAAQDHPELQQALHHWGPKA
ncbi:MAG: RuBisCO large subunit C-terminal-like domain-containing protein [Bacillota bacterium]|nr:RuBisCO large subunit C-terminal-like domain-containing protein [Bacillota bacterium]